MALPSNIEAQLYKFANPKIAFIEEYNQYIFDDNWLIDINKNTFKEVLRQILIEVNEHLKVGQNNRYFIKSLIQILDKKIDWFTEDEILNLNNFKDFTSKLKNSHADNIKSVPKIEKYSLDFIINCDDDIGSQLYAEENYYYDLWLFKNDFNNYKKHIDFEKVKLRYIIQLFYDYLNIAFKYLDALLIDYNIINFSEFDYDKLLEHFDLQSNTNTNQSVFNKKCHVNLNKKQTAQLFAFLMETELISFHTDQRKNRAELSKFIQSNFTYNGDNNTKSVIKNINQEFSDLSYPNQTKQLPFAKELLQIVQKRISELE